MYHHGDPLSRKKNAIERLEVTEGYNVVAHGMLNALSPAEVLALETSAELTDRLYDIALAADNTLIKSLEEEGVAQVREQSFQGYGVFDDDVPYIDLGQGRESLPKWMRASNLSTIVLPMNMEEFRRDAREILLRRLRLNIWKKIISNLWEKTQERKSKETKFPGNYL